MSLVKRAIYINTVEPARLAFRAPSGMETLLEVTFHDQDGSTASIDYLPQLELVGRSSNGEKSFYSMPATDVANGKARAVIPAGALTDPNGYRINLYGTVESIPTLLATGLLDLLAAAGALASPPDVIDRIDIELSRGSPTELVVTLWVDTAKTIPFDLASVTVGANVYDVQGGRVLMPFTVASVSGNRVTISLTAGQVDALPASCWWSLTVSDVSGVTTLCEGTVTVL